MESFERHLFDSIEILSGMFRCESLGWLQLSRDVNGRCIQKTGNEENNVTGKDDVQQRFHFVHSVKSGKGVQKGVEKLRGHGGQVISQP